MRVRCAVAAVSALSCLVLLAGGCGANGRLVKQYEYEEEVYLDLDGSATIIVNTSVPALVALAGVDLDTDARSRFDRTAVRRLYDTPVADLNRVSRPWRRDGRRFVQIRLEADDITELPRARPFAWSRYRFERDGDAYVFRQVIGPPANKPVGSVGWKGDELVAFRLHLPSKIEYHNAPSRRVERGNILAWEQPLADRLAGKPVEIDVRMAGESILYRTLILFGLSFAAAAGLLGLVVWWLMRPSRKRYG